MDFLFSGCNNLNKLIGFEDLNTSSVIKTAGIFTDCQNLMSANLSNFELDNIEESSGMFINNPSLKIVDLGNCSNANDFFSTQSNYSVILFARENNNVINESFFEGNFTLINKFPEIQLIEEKFYISSSDCEVGEGELCKEYDNKN